MKLSLLTPRDTETNITFILSFTVSFGPPSEIACSRNGIEFFSRINSVFLSAVVSREVIRSHYINSSYPDMTRVILTQTTPRESRTYTCTVTVTGRSGVSTSYFAKIQLGSGTSTASITGECCTLLTTSPPPPPPLSCKPSHCCYSQQDWFKQCSDLLVCPSSTPCSCVLPGSWWKHTKWREHQQHGADTDWTDIRESFILCSGIWSRGRTCAAQCSQ